MTVRETPLPGLLVIEPIRHGDARGYFAETYRADRYTTAGIAATFVQDNLSRSARGTLRGLHAQAPPHAQAKLVHVLDGEVFDVAVDVRPESETFGQWVGETLSAENGLQLYIPPGFAHGFVVTSEAAVFSYKCTQRYAPASEVSIRWDDPEIGIDWPVASPIVSGKDAAAPPLQQVFGSRRLLRLGPPRVDVLLALPQPVAMLTRPACDGERLRLLLTAAQAA